MHQSPTPNLDCVCAIQHLLNEAVTRRLRSQGALKKLVRSIVMRHCVSSWIFWTRRSTFTVPLLGGILTQCLQPMPNVWVPTSYHSHFIVRYVIAVLFIFIWLLHSWHLTPQAIEQFTGSKITANHISANISHSWVQHLNGYICVLQWLIMGNWGHGSI